jgi:hypothetical protein
MENATEIVLNPSFVVPAFYCSAVINIIMVYIVIRIVGLLRRVLKKLGDDSTLILQSGEDENPSTKNTNSPEQNIENKEDLF